MEIKEFNEKYNVVKELRVVNLYSIELSGNLDSLKEYEINSDLVETDYEIGDSRYSIAENKTYKSIASGLSFDELKSFIKEL